LKRYQLASKAVDSRPKYFNFSKDILYPKNCRGRWIKDSPGLEEVLNKVRNLAFWDDLYYLLQHQKILEPFQSLLHVFADMWVRSGGGDSESDKVKDIQKTTEDLRNAWKEARRLSTMDGEVVLEPPCIRLMDQAGLVKLEASGGE
jgi:hypothetical protein